MLLYNERFNLIRKQIKGKDALVDAILDNPQGPEALLYESAKDIFETKIKRQYAEACLLASSDLGAVSQTLDLSVDVIKMYRDVYYDVSNFNKLTKLEMLDKIRDLDEMTLKTWALHQGLDFIAWRLGKPVVIQPGDGLTELFSTCIYKSKEALFNSNSTIASKESATWVKLSLQIASLLKIWTTDNDSAKKEIELAIQSVTPEFTSLDDILAAAEKANKEI